MTAPLLLLWVVFFGWICGSTFSQIVCPVPSNSTLCTAISRTPRRNLKCGVNGVSKHPDILGEACASPSLETCRDSCVLNPHCFSFSFNQRDIMSGICTLYRSSVIAQGFRANSNSTTQFWNRHCFKKSCPNLGCPSDDFKLLVGGGTQYDGSYIIRSGTTAGFTTDITMATYFTLDSKCRMAPARSKNIIGNDFNSAGITLPGPLYFTDKATVKAQAYDPAICKLAKGPATFSCTYGNMTGRQFFSCQGVLSLPGPYSGDATCGAGNGNVTLTALGFKST